MRTTNYSAPGSICSAGRSHWPSARQRGSAQLLRAARRLEPLDVGLARETYLDAWGAALFAGPSGRGQLREVSQAARAAPARLDPPRLPDLLLDGLSLLVSEGRAAATPTLRKAVRAFPSEELSVEKGLQWGGWPAAPRSCCGTSRAWQAIYEPSVRTRPQGRRARTVMFHSHR